MCGITSRWTRLARIADFHIADIPGKILDFVGKISGCPGRKYPSLSLGYGNPDPKTAETFSFRIYNTSPRIPF